MIRYVPEHLCPITTIVINCNDLCLDCIARQCIPTRHYNNFLFLCSMIRYLWDLLRIKTHFFQNDATFFSLQSGITLMGYVFLFNWLVVGEANHNLFWWLQPPFIPFCFDILFCKVTGWLLWRQLCDQWDCSKATSKWFCIRSECAISINSDSGPVWHTKHYENPITHSPQLIHNIRICHEIII